MAAGQQKKRPNASNSLKITLHDGSRSKKPNRRDSSDINLNMAKKELVGIRWRDMAAFLDHVPRVKSCVADIVTVPRELFSRDNVANMFSYEVWETFLSEDERHLLAQFLPSGFDMDLLVKSLFSGENFHFGNPFSNWVGSLCSGNLHPEKIQQKERQLRACRNAYFVDLKEYHFGFIESIRKLKESWESLGDPDEDIEHKILRNTGGNPVASEEELQEAEIENGGSKYMSYIKISKKQHQMVMNARNSDDEIHPKCLSRILGDISCFSVKPYASFEEEERERMNAHWLKLANEDLPAAFENRGRHKMERNNMKGSIQCELMTKEFKSRELMAKKEEREMLTWTTHLEEADNETSELAFAHEPHDNRHIHSSYHHFTNCQTSESISLLNTSHRLDLERIMKQTTSPSDVAVDPSLDCRVGPPAWQFLGNMEQRRPSPPQEANDDSREAMYGDHAMLRSIPPEHLNRLEPSELSLSLANTTQYEGLIGLDHQLLLNRNGNSRARYIPVNSQESNTTVGSFSDPTWLPTGSSGSADGSLFCVLSECNKLLSGFRQNSAGPEQFPQEGGIYLSPALDSSGGRDGAGVWRNFPNQRPGLS